jgi:hypothetical protein
LNVDPGKLPTPSCPIWIPVTSSRLAAIRANKHAKEKAVLLFLLPMPYTLGEHDMHCNHLV